MTASQEQSFPASYDTTARIVSLAACAILIGVSFAVGTPIVAGVGALILLGAYAWSPRAYSVAGRTVFVHRLIGKAPIPLDTVREARRATPDDFRGGIRLFGSGGVFGYYGLFRTSKLGKSSWYLTNRTNAVVIANGVKTCLVSPDSPEQFLAAIRASVPVPAASPAGSFEAEQGSRRSTAGTLAAVLIILFIAGVIPFALLYSPGPPDYTLSAHALVIHDRFYPVTLSPEHVDVMRVRVIDMNSDAHWMPVMRTNGFANAHYRSGHFRVAGGETVRLYQAHGRRLVLLPPLGEGTPVLLEARDPDALAGELRREWSGPLLSNPPQG